MALIEPFECEAGPPASALDGVVEERLAKVGIEVGPSCSDAVFLRRVHLDLTGTLPDVDKVRAFLAERGADKRAAAIDRLLESAAHADYWR